MEGEIVNRVEKSGLITLDLGDFYPNGRRMELDIVGWLWEGLILKEKEFREHVKTCDWGHYQDAYVAINCSADAIVPDWAYMLIASKLQPIAKKYVFGSLETLNTLLFEEALEGLNADEFRDKRVLVKGCGDKEVPPSAYVKIVSILQPHVKSLMFGEACSSVPVFKRLARG